MKTIIIATPFIKLDALLKWAGISDTGGHGKEMIAQGLVKVNGQPCDQRGKKIHPGDTVELEGEEPFTVEQGEIEQY